MSPAAPPAGAGPDARQAGTLTRSVWVRFPRWVSGRSWQAGTLVTDGYWLAAVPGLGAVLPLLAAIGGVAVAVVRPGFETSFTESLPLLIALAAVGVISTHLGIALALGFAVGEVLLSGVPWRLELSDGLAAEYGVLADPWVAALVFERGPTLVHVTVLALLVVGVPTVGRQLAQSVAVYLRGRRWVDLSIATLLMALATGIVANLWAAAAPQAVRPLWVFVAPWERVPTVPVEAIASLQEQNRAIAGGIVAAVLVRAALVGLLSVADRAGRIGAVERALLTPLDRQPRIGWFRDLLLATLAGLVGVLVLAGMVDDAWVLGVILGVLAATSLARAGRIGLPTRRFRAAVTRLPVVARFGLGLLIVQGMINATVGTSQPSGESFQFLIWPLLAGVVVLSVLLPRPPEDAESRHDAAPVPFARSAVVVLIAAWVWSAGAVGPAWAHNCQDFADCFNTVDAIVSGVTGVVFLLGMVAISFSPLGTALGLVEAVTGRDSFTGERLDPHLRFLGMLPFLRLGRAARGLRGAGPPPRVPRPTVPPPGRRLPGPGEATRRPIPEHVLRRMREGRAFNETRAPAYPANEVRLTNGKVVDSLVPGEEIVSRKHTQLAGVQPGTGRAYLNEIPNKYARGEDIADTPVNRQRYPDLVGESLDGRYVLEVPVQRSPVPRELLEQAARQKILVRDPAGRVYNLEHPGGWP